MVPGGKAPLPSRFSSLPQTGAEAERPDVHSLLVNYWKGFFAQESFEVPIV